MICNKLAAARAGHSALLLISNVSQSSTFGNALSALFTKSRYVCVGGIHSIDLPCYHDVIKCLNPFGR